MRTANEVLKLIERLAVARRAVKSRKKGEETAMPLTIAIVYTLEWVLGINDDQQSIVALVEAELENFDKRRAEHRAARKAVKTVQRAKR